MFGLIKRNNNVNSYNPFREMDDFERNFFKNPFDNFFSMNDLAEFKTDITDEGDHYLLEADLPGFDKKDIHLEVQGDCLTISCERHSKVEEKDNKNKIVSVERSYGSYKRQFDISQVDANKIKAKYKNGVLQLILPKLDEITPQTRQLEIE